MTAKQMFDDPTSPLISNSFRKISVLRQLIARKVCISCIPETVHASLRTYNFESKFGFRQCLGISCTQCRLVLASSEEQGAFCCSRFNGVG